LEQAKQPIGIFDSGVGGLTVANAILGACPGEQLIYFGDTAHLPYGDKSADLVKGYSERISDFLLERHCKTIVIACNTASSVAYDAVLDRAGNRSLVFNVIDPVVSRIVEKGYKRIGVIGTLGTIGSNVYYDKIKAADRSLKVYSLATPMLVPMIESGFIHGQISSLIIEQYLDNDILEEIDALVLGCTHYPLIRKDIEKHYAARGRAVDVLATNEIVGAYVHSHLEKAGLLQNGDPPDVHHFYVSDYTSTFEQTTRLFYGSEVKLEHLNFWQEHP
jgi:glutamate racemase